MRCVNLQGTKKRIFAEKETFSSIPVDGKCRNVSGPVEALQQ